MTTAQARRLALILMSLRRLMVRGLICRLTEDEAGDEITRAEFRALASLLPLPLLVNDGLRKRVEAPTERMMQRQGVLALVEWSQHG